LTDGSPDDSHLVKDTYTSFIMFHRPGFTLEDAADALAKSSLTVESRSDPLLGDYLLVRRTPGVTPVLRVYLSRAPHVQEEAAEIGEGTPYAVAAARCDARFEICFDDLDEVLDEINLLIETQSTLHEATQAVFMFNSWRGELVDLNQDVTQMTTDPKRGFRQWLDYMDDALGEWYSWLPEHVRDKLDFSIESLDALEAWLLDRYPSFDAAMAESESLIFDGAARYIGETFRKMFGGHWEEDPKKYVYHGIPYITGFSIRGLMSPCPITMATASVDRRRGDFISSIFRSYKADFEGKRGQGTDRTS